jgi:hypothetical protein
MSYNSSFATQTMTELCRIATRENLTSLEWRCFGHPYGIHNNYRNGILRSLSWTVSRAKYLNFRNFMQTCHNLSLALMYLWSW